jgi:hypothetical protein
MSIQSRRQLENTRKKLQLLEERYQSLISSPAENAIAPNFTRRSLKKLINQMKEEITRFRGARERQARRDLIVPDGDINADSAHSGIVPLYIGPMPSNGIPYSPVILDVAPDEFARIKMPEPKLPQSWTIDKD